MSASLKLARLLSVLHAGESLAAHAAARQAALAPQRWMSRALRVQALQELGHAGMATAALALNGTRGHGPDALAALRTQLNRDLDQGRLAASFLGLQGVVEHLGEALLETLGTYTHPAGAPLHALRVRVLAQERGHVQLGARCLRTFDTQAYASRADLGAALDEYRAIGASVALQVADLLDDARLDGAVFWRGVDVRLTQWHEKVVAV